MRVFFFVVALLGLGAGIGTEHEALAKWFNSEVLIYTKSHRGNKYVTAPVAIGEIRKTITATGSLQAVSTVLVSSQLSGQISRLYADFNDLVTIGQPLAELDQRGLRARLVQAEAEFKMSRERIAILKAQLDRTRGEEREARARRRTFAAKIDKARAKLEAADRTQARTETLASRGTAAKTAVEDARSERKAAAADLREAQADADAHEHAVAASEARRREAESDIANAEAALPLREAAVTLAQLDLEHSTLRSPIDGVVVGRNVEQGQIVAASFDAPTLFTIAGDLAAMEIHARIDEADIAAIAIGQSATFAVDAYSGETFSATVSEVRKASLVLQGVVAYTVVLKASNADGRLLPGMTATVRIIVEELGPVRTIPLIALRYNPGLAAGPAAVIWDSEIGSTSGIVWTIGEDDKPQPRKLRLGADDGHDVAVLDGELSAGAQVIVSQVASSEGFQPFGIRF